MSEEWLRNDWTPEEVSQVRERLAPENVPDALELFAPNEWPTYYEYATDDELEEELAMLRVKAERMRAAREMGLGVEEAALWGAMSMAIEHEHETGREDAEGGR
jgi:hypothetical protein